MFILVCIVLFALLLFAYVCYDNRVDLMFQQDAETYREIKAIKAEMIEFIHRPDRVKYWNRIYTWIYHNDKDVYNWISDNPAWVQEHWLVRGVDIDEDVCRFAVNKDAEKVLEQFYQESAVSEEKIEVFGKTEWRKTFLVRGPQGYTNKRFMEWFSHIS